MKVKQLWQNESVSDGVLIVEVRNEKGEAFDIHHLKPSQSVITEITNPDYTVTSRFIPLEKYPL